MFCRKNHGCEHSGAKMIMAVIIGVFAAIGMIGSVMLLKDKLGCKCGCSDGGAKNVINKLSRGAEKAVDTVAEKVEDLMDGNG